MSKWKPFSLLNDIVLREKTLELHLDQGEPHILVRREAVEHEDGRFVPRPATEGIAELIVFMANVADLHAQSPPPVPGKEKYRQNNISKLQRSSFERGTGPFYSLISRSDQHFSRPLSSTSHSGIATGSTLKEHKVWNGSRKYLKWIFWYVMLHHKHSN